MADVVCDAFQNFVAGHRDNRCLLRINYEQVLSLAIDRVRAIHDVPAITLTGAQRTVTIVEDQTIYRAYVVAPFVAKVAEDFGYGRFAS